MLLLLLIPTPTPLGSFREAVFSRWKEAKKRKSKEETQVECGSKTWIPMGLGLQSASFRQVCWEVPLARLIPSQLLGLKECWLLCERSCNRRFWSCILIGPF